MGKFKQSVNALKSIWSNHPKTNREKIVDMLYRKMINGTRSTHYDAAFTNRIREDWGTSKSTPYTDIKGSLSKLLSRSRREIDNNGIASGITKTISNNVWGEGPVIQAQVKSSDGELQKGINKSLEDAWLRFSDEIDASGYGNFNLFGRLILETIIASGTCILNRVPNKRGKYLKLAYQTFEPDILDDGRDIQKVTEHQLIKAKQVLHGIAIDESYSPLAYYIKGLKNTISSDYMRHFYIRKRPQQIIGVPWLSASLSDLFDYRQLKEDTIVKSRILADIALWLSQEGGIWPGDEATNSDGEIEWEPGSMIRTKEKPEVIQAEGDLNAILTPLLNRVLLDACSGIGLSYMAASRDMNGVNFAASRTNLNEDRAGYKMVRAWIVSTYCQYIWNNFVTQCVIEGKVNISPDSFAKDQYKYTRASFLFPSWDWVDPRADTDSMVNMYSSGLTSLKDSCAKRSIDWRDHIDQKVEEYLYMKKISETKDVPIEELMSMFENKNGGNNAEEQKPAIQD